MKKFLSLFITLALVVGMLSAFTVSAAVNTTVFYNALTNEPITSLDGVDSIYATTTFTGRYENNASVIVSHYSADGKLTGIEFINPVESTIGADVTYTTGVISVTDTDIIKLFAWTGVDTVKPLLKFPGVISRVEEIALPTATVTALDVDEITDVALTYAMNFTADSVTEAQLLAYGTWYADYELTVNRDVTFSADGTKDGYLAGQYDSWSPYWLSVPSKAVSVAANTPLKIMETAAETYGKAGLKYTYMEVYDRVKDFDCGVFFSPEFLAANDGLEVTLALKMYNPADESESYIIGEPYTFTWSLPSATVTKLDVADIDEVDLTFGLNFKADSVTEAQMAMFSDWYADYELVLNKTATFNANGTCDGFLAGQYDAWSANWISVPTIDATIEANTPVRVMESAAALMGKPGLKLTCKDIYTSVQDFNCGLGFSPEFLIANPDLEATLALKIYNPENESECYVIGETYTFTPETIPSIDKFIAKEGVTYTHTLETAEDATVTFAFEELFTVIAGVPMDWDNLTVTGATYIDGNIVVEGFGAKNITVTDNYYCNEATATVIVNEPANVDKFTGNTVTYTHTLDTIEGNTVTFDFADLFTNNGYDVKDITVTGATYADGKVTVEGLGAITVTATDNYYCNEATATVIVNVPGAVDKFIGKNIEVTHTLDTVESNVYTVDFTDLFDTNGYAVKDITVTGGTYKDGKVTVEGFGTITVTATDNFYCNVATATITVNEPESVDKFIGNTVTKQLVYGENTVTVAFDELFTTNGYDVKEITVGGDGVYENGVVTFTGAGTYTVTVTDNFYCNEATATVIVEEPEIVPEVKFTKKFTKDFLYRVGNQNTVSLGTLFSGIETVDSAAVNVTYEVVDGDVTMAYTKNTSNWANATVKFGGTGVVTVTITDGELCIPTELTVEIVTATNLTSAQGTTTGGNFVLVKDINTSTYVNYRNSTVYGNGFTYSLKGAPTAYNSKQGHGILITKDTTFDNLVIVGDVYNEYGAYSNNDYFNAAIDAQNGTVIQNCYIANCAAPVVTRGNTTIVNSTLYGGTVANLNIKDGIVTLENVTTANFDDGRALVGMGIVAHSDVTDNAKLILKGTFKQYNFMSETKKPSDTSAQQIYNTMFGSSTKAYQFGTSPNRHVNTGIVSMSGAFTVSDITDGVNTGYEATSVSLLGNSGFVYSQKNTVGSVDNNYSIDADAHYATTQGAVAPTYAFDYTTKNYVEKTEGSNDYCYLENGVVNIAMDQGDVFNWDTSILTATKNGHTLAYTVSMNGTDYTGKSIPFSVADDYEVVYQYTDPYNTKLDENGNLITYSVTYTKTVHISVSVVAKAAKSAEFKFGSSNTASKTVTVGSTTYVMPDVSATSSTIGSKSVSGTTVYYPIVEIIMSDGKTSHSSGWYAYFPVLSGVVTITDYADGGSGDPFTYNGSTTTMPAGLSLVGDATQLFKYQSSSNAGSSPVVKSNKLVYSSASISAKRDEYNTVVEYTYKDSKGDIFHYYVGYHAPAQSYSSCFTEDTMITMGDGSKKAVKDITKDDVILSYNFFTGEYEATDVALLVAHGEDTYSVANLTFSDGTTLRIIGDHGVFDYDTNEYAYLTVDNMADYIGHTFVKQGENGAYELVTLEKAVRTEETIGAYSLTSAGNANAFAEGMLTMAPPGDFYNWIEMGDKLRYDAEKFQNDIETYGLYTFEDFGGLVTYEQFVELNGAYLKIAVEKGLMTWDYIVELIGLYVNP